MTARQQWAAVGTIILVLGVGLGIASHEMRDQLFPVVIGTKAPNFKAKDLTTNQDRTLANYSGKPFLLNVWATWCEPCQAEIPTLEKLYKLYGDKGLKIVAVSVDRTASEDSIRAFARHFGMTFDLLHDPTGDIEQTYQTTGYPETFIVGPEGTIRKKVTGADDWTSPGNQALVAQLLGLAPARTVVDTADR